MQAEEIILRQLQDSPNDPIEQRGDLTQVQSIQTSLIDCARWVNPEACAAISAGNGMLAGS